MIPREVFEETLLQFFEPIRPLLEDPTVSDIVINGPSKVFVERAGILYPTMFQFANEEALMAALLQKRIRMQGFVILDHYGERFDAFHQEMGDWIAAGKVKPHEDVVHGLDNAPAAFIGLLQGRNFGKLVVHVAHA